MKHFAGTFRWVQTSYFWRVTGKQYNLYCKYLYENVKIYGSFLHEWNKWKNMEIIFSVWKQEISVKLKKKIPSLEITVYVPRWSKAKCVFIGTTSNIPWNCSLRFPMISKFIICYSYMEFIFFQEGGCFWAFPGGWWFFF